jgi:hypothetical protein
METKGIINDSGYPLQILIEHLVKTQLHENGWAVLVKEHQWSDPDTGNEGFIDLILGSHQYNIRLIIECKRVSGKWNFLLPTGTYPSGQTRLLFAGRKSIETPWNITWKDGFINPECEDAVYCVMEVEGKKDNRTLEKYSSELLNALESLAQQETKINNFPNIPLKNVQLPPVNAMYYMSIIVTTAKLQKCVIDPLKINIDDGKIDNGIVSQIPFIRFRKNLPSIFETDNSKITNIKEMNLANERSVFIVQADKFVEFLSRFSI